jgi:penicillin-binding protein 2
LYPRDGFAAHLIGYVGEVSEEMLNDPKYAYYEPGDVVGRSGPRAELRPAACAGSTDRATSIVDSHGREVGGWERSPRLQGKSLKLTIDLDIQKAAELALGNRNGAMIAMDPHTGEILALVSRPTFDPNEFSVRIRRDEWNKLITDPEPSAAGQSDPGAAGSRIDLQDHHGGGGAASGRRPGPEGALPRRGQFYGHY